MKEESFSKGPSNAPIAIGGAFEKNPSSGSGAQYFNAAALC